MQHDHDLHQRLLAGLWMMLISRGRLRELNEHADAALEGEKAPTTPLSAWLGNLRAYQLGFAGHHAEAWAAIESVIAFARASNDKRELALALDTGALVHLELGETGAAIEAAQESLELVRHAGEPRLLAWALLTLAGTLIENERFAECERLLDEAAALAEGPASDVDLGIATMRADIAFGRNDHSHALELYASSLALAEQLGDSLQTVNDALAVVSLLSLRGHTDAALEADALLTAIAHDANYDGVTSARVMRQKALAAMGAPAATHAADAARRAAAIPASERVTQILALVRTVNQPRRLTNGQQPPCVVLAAGFGTQPAGPPSRTSRRRHLPLVRITTRRHRRGAPAPACALSSRRSSTPEPCSIPVAWSKRVPPIEFPR